MERARKGRRGVNGACPEGVGVSGEGKSGLRNSERLPSPDKGARALSRTKEREPSREKKEFEPLSKYGKMGTTMIKLKSPPIFYLYLVSC